MRALRHLYLNDNALTVFNGTGLSLLWTLDIQDNHISSLPKVTGMKKIKNLSSTNNCLARTRLDTAITVWLDKYNNGVSWENQSNDCSLSFLIPSIQTITDTDTSITWNTDMASSSSVEYGLTADSRIATNEINTLPRTLQHVVNLTGLVACTTYDYRVVSRDADGNILTSVGNTFITTGCAAASNVLDTSSEQINRTT